MRSTATGPSQVQAPRPCPSVGIVTSPRNDIHDSIFDELEGRISTLRSGAPTSAPDGGAWTQAEVDAELAQLENDKALLLALEDAGRRRRGDGAGPSAGLWSAAALPPRA